MPDWLQTIAEINPLTHSNIIVRKLVIDSSLNMPLNSLLYLLAIAVSTTLIGVLLSRKLLQHL